jgi:hypothetical protein
MEGVAGRCCTAMAVLAAEPRCRNSPFSSLLKFMDSKRIEEIITPKDDESIVSMKQSKDQIERKIEQPIDSLNVHSRLESLLGVPGLDW